jgi:hypothetical protein
MSLKKVIANMNTNSIVIDNHKRDRTPPFLDHLEVVMAFCSKEDVAKLFSLNQEYKEKTLQVAEKINRPFKDQLKEFNPLEAAAILKYSEQFLNENGFIGEDSKIDVNKQINRNGKNQYAIDLALSQDIPNKRLILEGVFCRGFDLSSIRNPVNVTNQLIKLRVIKAAYDISLKLIQMHDFTNGLNIGIQFAQNKGIKEAYNIAIELIRKNENNGVFIIADFLSQIGAYKEAYDICIELIENDALRGIDEISNYFKKQKEYAMANEIDLKIINRHFKDNPTGRALASEENAKSVSYRTKELIQNEEYSKAETIAYILYETGEEEKANKIWAQINSHKYTNRQPFCSIS